MRIDEYQQQAARTMNRRLEPSDVILDAAAGLCEESGEVLAHVRKHLFQGRDLRRDEVAEELGDALWCIAAVATSLGFSLEEVARRNVAKLAARHPDGIGG
jgi:NTP pyrophosphatase (non-canonical NTP hydrolase)